MRRASFWTALLVVAVTVGRCLEAGAGRVLGLDRDAEALPIAEATLSGWSDRIELVHANFCEVETVLDVRGISTVEGAVADLGMSHSSTRNPGTRLQFPP